MSFIFLYIKADVPNAPRAGVAGVICSAVSLKLMATC